MDRSLVGHGAAQPAVAARHRGCIQTRKRTGGPRRLLPAEGGGSLDTASVLENGPRSTRKKAGSIAPDLRHGWQVRRVGGQRGLDGPTTVCAHALGPSRSTPLSRGEDRDDALGIEAEPAALNPAGSATKVLRKIRLRREGDHRARAGRTAAQSGAARQGSPAKLGSARCRA